VGHDPFPDEFAEYQRTWVEHHPDWELKMWTEDNLPNDLRRREIYEKLRCPAERADILRLEVLWRYGGIYFDTDYECVRPLEDLIDGLDFFVAYLKPGRINNAFLGCIPNHRILDEAIRTLRPREYYGYDKGAAGPLFLDNHLRKYGRVKKFDAELFNPNTPAQYKAAYAIHHRARSWMQNEGFKEVAQIAEQRLLETQKRLEDAERKLAEYQLAPGIRTRVSKLIAKNTTKMRYKLARNKTIHRPIRATRKKAQSVYKRIRWLARKLVPTKIVWAIYRRLRLFINKVILRGIWRLYNRRYRHTYRTSLSRVPSRDELPELLNRRQLFGRGAEIGVKAGKYSEYLLRHWKGSQLISIDPWISDAPENYVDRANVSQQEHDRYYAAVTQALAVFGERSEIWRKTSVEAAKNVDDRSLDFVYIDARHDYESVLEDLEQWFNKVRRGGIIAGHDYVDGAFNQGDFGVKKAVDEFFARRKLSVYSTEGRWPVEMFPSWMVEVPDKIPEIAGDRRQSPSQTKTEQADTEAVTSVLS